MLFLLGLVMIGFGLWCLIVLREKNGVRHPLLKLPTAEVVAPLVVLCLMVFGAALAIAHFPTWG